MNFCPKCGTRVKLGAGKPPKICFRCGASMGDGDGFPFKAKRPQQQEVMDKIVTALSESKKFIVLEAPVGFGKSAIATWLCNRVESAYLLTSTKQLQDQYSLDFGYPVVTGKSNFTCLVPTSSGKLTACSKGRCQVDWTLSECPHYLTFEQYDDHRKGLCSRSAKCNSLKDGKLCVYYEQKWDAFRAPVAVANYSFFLAELRHTDDIKRRRLLVCDEAHDLEKQMVDAASYSLSKSVMQSYHMGSGRQYAIPNKGLDQAAAWKEPLAEEKNILETFLEANLADRTMQDRVASCRSSLDSLEWFVDDLSGNSANWIVNGVREVVTLDGVPSLEEVNFRPLEIGSYTSALFETADTVLLMSATVFSKEAFCRALGIRETDCAFIQIKESSFPVENRRIVATNTARLNRATMEGSMDSIVAAVDEIMTRHSGERGVVHTTSYWQTNYILEHLTPTNRARLSSTQGNSSRSALLKTHGSIADSVLISPSLYMGVDLKEELSRFQIVVKVPYPDLSDRRTKIKGERDPQWYEWQTALRLVQTYGRSVRSETDHAVTYVLDSNFGLFLRKNRDLFPDYFLEAVIGNSTTTSHNSANA
jgi:ATP-dependent DNA helicase DinG